MDVVLLEVQKAWAHDGMGREVTGTGCGEDCGGAAEPRSAAEVFPGTWGQENRRGGVRRECQCERVDG
eukprot:1567611-Rhodomonas_salina.1